MSSLRGFGRYNQMYALKEEGVVSIKKSSSKTSKLGKELAVKLRTIRKLNVLAAANRELSSEKKHMEQQQIDLGEIEANSDEAAGLPLPLERKTSSKSVSFDEEHNDTRNFEAERLRKLTGRQKLKKRRALSFTTPRASTSSGDLEIAVGRSKIHSSSKARIFSMGTFATMLDRSNGAKSEMADEKVATQANDSLDATFIIDHDEDGDGGDETQTPEVVTPAKVAFAMKRIRENLLHASPNSAQAARTSALKATPIVQRKSNQNLKLKLSPSAAAAIQSPPPVTIPKLKISSRTAAKISKSKSGVFTKPVFARSKPAVRRELVAQLSSKSSLESIQEVPEDVSMLSEEAKLLGEKSLGISKRPEADAPLEDNQSAAAYWSAHHTINYFLGLRSIFFLIFLKILKYVFLKNTTGPLLDYWRKLCPPVP